VLGKDLTGHVWGKKASGVINIDAVYQLQG